MKKLQRRAIICLCLAAILFMGVVLYVFRYCADGSDWASFAANSHIYTNGTLNQGEIYDTDGTVLAAVDDNGNRYYNDSASLRRATVHAVGDKEGNIGSGALTAFGARLAGYNLITGTHSLTGHGRELTLTIDGDVCKAAYEALDGRHGTVGVYNYETGDIICLVSSPGLDPADASTAQDGSYVNRLLSATFVPGSIFKLVTAAAALDTLPNAESWTYTCTGVNEIDGQQITCPNAHGEVNLGSALTVSCNCAFGELTRTLGGDTMKTYVRKLGLTSSISVDGIDTSRGSFTFDHISDASLAWAGIGQYEDLLNPCAMMVYMGAIANGGTPVYPRLIESVKAGKLPLSLPLRHKGSRMLSETTAGRLAELMHNNVVNNYGEGNYPNLDLCAKSGTAEVGGDSTPHAWFAGFIRNPDSPLAFIVLVENGGSGSRVAGAVANSVLQAAIRN